MRIQKLFTSLALPFGLLAVAILLGLLGDRPAASQSRASNTYTVCPAGPPTCNFAVIQDAVNAAGEGDLIKVSAGTYSQINNHGGLAQVVYIDKRITIAGGYNLSFADPPDPVANHTTLDAQGRGRVIYVTGYSAPVIEGFHITGGNAAGLGGGDTGGGMLVSRGAAMLDKSTIFNNTPTGISMVDSAVTLRENTVSENNSDGLFLSYSHAILSRNTITANLYSGLRIDDSTATLSENTISRNHSMGLYVHNSTITLNDNVIISNVYEGVYLENCTATLRENTISYNSASAHGGGLNSWFSDVTLIRNTISHNTASGDGGGVHLYGTTASISDNTIISNTASVGGGLYLMGTDGALSGNIIAGNTANYSSGGGLHLVGGNITLTNNIVVNNQANWSGSGVYVRISSPHLLHTTIARNTGGDGSGVYVAESSSVRLTNTILVSQTVGIYVYNGSSASLEATLWGSDAWANVADWGGDGTVTTGTINIQGDPGFVNPGAWDYHIGPGSKALDIGVAAGVITDIDHEPRFADPDLGADECWTSEAFARVKHVYLPVIARNTAKCGDFFDDFSNQASGWDVGEDDFVLAEYLAGEYRVRTKKAGYIYLFQAPTCNREDYTVELDARWVGTPGSSYGILFGITGSFSKYYLFDINTDFKELRLYRRDSNGFTEIVPITSSSAINGGTAPNHIRATRFGRWITLEVNGTVLGRWSDTGISGFTSVGLVSGPYLSNGVSDARFDNFRVTGLPPGRATTQKLDVTAIANREFYAPNVILEPVIIDMGWQIKK